MNSTSVFSTPPSVLLSLVRKCRDRELNDEEMQSIKHVATQQFQTLAKQNEEVSPPLINRKIKIQGGVALVLLVLGIFFQGSAAVSETVNNLDCPNTSAKAGLAFAILALPTLLGGAIVGRIYERKVRQAEILQHQQATRKLHNDLSNMLEEQLDDFLKTMNSFFKASADSQTRQEHTMKRLKACLHRLEKLHPENKKNAPQDALIPELLQKIPKDNPVRQDYDQLERALDAQDSHERWMNAEGGRGTTLQSPEKVLKQKWRALEQAIGFEMPQLIIKNRLLLRDAHLIHVGVIPA